MKLTRETAKAWKNQYALINEISEQERQMRLQSETVQESIRRFFFWNQLLIAFAGRSDLPEEMQEAQADHYLALIARWQKLAEKIKHV